MKTHAFAVTKTNHILKCSPLKTTEMLVKYPMNCPIFFIVEQQLICRIAPCINVHLLKHGGIGSSGHCVTFPQKVNEPAQIFPRLPSEIHILKVCKQGKNETSKNVRVSRSKVQNALMWLKQKILLIHIFSFLKIG